jgi:GT2 family glycosyltransferase
MNALTEKMTSRRLDVLVGAVVVAYNSADDLGACLRSLDNAGVEHVVVIENGSCDEHRARSASICASFDFVEFEQLPTNRGFGAGVNHGVGHLRHHIGPDDFIWIVNPDTEVHADSVPGLIHAVRQSGFDIVSPRVTTTRPDGKRVTWYGGGVLDHSAVRSLHLELGEIAVSAGADRECTFITGAAMFMRLSTWDRIGGFSEDFFLYWEDADLSARASRLGLTLGLAGSSTVWHSVGGSGDRSGKSAVYFYYMQRNRILFSKKAGLFGNLFTVRGLLESIRLTVRPLKQTVDPIGKFLSGLKGLRDGYFSKMNPREDGAVGMPNDRTKPIFISWTKENGRSEDLAKTLGADLVSIYPSGNLLMRYAKSSIRSYQILRSLNVETAAFMMLPPMPLALVAKSARRGSPSKNFFDLHTGFFHDPKWRWLSGVALRTMRGSIAIVTNENLQRICRRAGVESVILHDVLRPLPSTGTEQGTDVVCPVSYSNDEPIDAILDAASSLPHTNWVLTGRAPAMVVKKAPPNIRFTGFVEDDEYDRLISQAGIVLALTNRKDTMQRAAYEAILRGVPVVTSEFDVLQQFFEDAALYVVQGETNLTEQVANALENRDFLVRQGKLVLDRRIHEQVHALAKIKELVSL